MTNNRLAVIVLNWNCAEDAVACIDSLLVNSLVPDIILVDNDSRDNSVEVLDRYIASHKDANIHFIKNKVNSGYSGGNNVGFEVAKKYNYELVGTLNPDATADTAWTKSLVDELDEHSEVGMVGGKLLRSDGKTIDSTGDFYTTWGIPGPRGRNQPASTAPTAPGYVFGITGGGFITRTSMLRDIGTFDEKFFMYFEDVDLCFRAQLAGYKIRYTPKAVAYHKISASTNKVPGLAIQQTFKNLPMLFTKNVPLSLWPHIYPRFVLAYKLILVHAITLGRGVPALKGFLTSWILLPHMFSERARIQRTRKVTNAYIKSIILHDIPPEQTGLRKFRRFFTGKP